MWQQANEAASSERKEKSIAFLHDLAAAMMGSERKRKLPSLSIERRKKKVHKRRMKGASRRN